MKKKKKELSLSWKHHAGRNMVVWQIMFTGSGTLVAQKRDAERRQAFFFSLDPGTGTSLTEGFQPQYSEGGGPAGEGWFTGLESTSEKLVYCHAYQQNSPEHLGIWAFEADSATLAWLRTDLVFSANLDSALLVYRPSVFAGFPERHFMLLDPLSGVTLRELGEENPETMELRRNAIPEEERQQLVLPEFAGNGALLPELPGTTLPAYAMTEYIMAGRVTVIALHEQGGARGGWKSSLRVYTDDLVYEDCMQRNAEAPVQNNFLIRGHKLYYIKEKEELVSVGLS
ncbi:MAG: DUF4905 domain-containing protein [Chlorobiaceae bacterium]|nr:DUF4905 domain-containing protein [Chlorobiaceae bacterium]NTV61067.1 DUF4905 domain-containing protein [Chlorobiaceae bacterium]